MAKWDTFVLKLVQRGDLIRQLPSDVNFPIRESAKIKIWNALIFEIGDKIASPVRMVYKENNNA